MRIAVVSLHGKPLSPTTPAKARKLIKSGGAIPKRDKLGTFYLQLTHPTREEIPHDTVVGIDPGKLYSGVSVQTPQATLWMGHLVLPFPLVQKAMADRRQSRRFRRYRKTPHRPIHFLHRTGHKIPPSIKANRELEWRVLQELAKIYPITHVVYEVVKARGTQSFSPVMVGQQWQMNRLAERWPLEPRQGWETAQLRLALDLKKTRKKAERSPASHAVDGVALAASHFLHYVPFYEKNGDHGQRWEGTCHVTEAPFAVIQRPLFFRRALHFRNPLSHGRRKRKGGTITPWSIRKGDYVEAMKAGLTVRGYVSGYTQTPTTKALSVADARWHRLGQFAVSHVRLLSRSARLLVTPFSSARC
ncbi:RRXRR domain-containing protein [Sulfobacillus harzensis]|uniref:RRXRR domain-containing protein n=1 Tax=Sulfobacillus harzensis TaxID=2729629 RepID=A0A7Y0Q4V1_9FIRM|nr:RRXRR domain-containing protein [Sulfobacillus harzensis]NMP24421.1 hypothetical protein [Sulfobacillus harzensis]